MAPSSAYDSAPHRDRSAAAAQARSTAAGVPTDCVIGAVFKNTPVPTMVPMTSAVASPSPRLRLGSPPAIARLGRRAGRAGLGQRVGDFLSVDLDARLLRSLDHDARLGLGARVA